MASKKTSYGSNRINSDSVVFVLESLSGREPGILKSEIRDFSTFGKFIVDLHNLQKYNALQLGEFISMLPLNIGRDSLLLHFCGPGWMSELFKVQNLPFSSLSSDDLSVAIKDVVLT